MGNRQHPGAIRKPGNYWWLAPDFPQAMRVGAKIIRDYLGKLAKYSAQSRTFTLKHNGSEITIKSADSTLRGEGLDGVVVDEAAFIAERIYTEEVSPALMDKNGFLYMGTTPNGFNWLYDLWQRTQRLHDWGHFEAPTSLNPLVNMARIEAMRELMGAARWSQEYAGKFVAAAEAIFAAEYFTDILTPSLPETGWQRAVIAVDLSLGGIDSDWQAVVFLGQTGGRLYADLQMFRLDVEPLLDQIWALKERYRCHCLVWEDVGFQRLIYPIWQRKFEREVPVQHAFQKHTGKDSKTARISILTAPLARRELKILDTPMGRAGLNQIRDYPASQFDDVPDALAMAYYALCDGVGVL